MFVLLEILGFGLLLLAVWTLRRVASRQDDPGLKIAGRVALIVWVGFVLWRAVDLTYLVENWVAVLQAVAVFTGLAAVILVYRAILAHIRDRANGSS